MLGGFLQPEDASPQGGVRAAYLSSLGLARATGELAAIDVFHDSLLLRSYSTVRLTLPQGGVPVTVLPRRQLVGAGGDYYAVYAPETEQEHYLPHGLRPLDDAVPVICEIGTSFSADQWTRIFVGAATGAIRPTDVFMVKARATEQLFHALWRDWSAVIGTRPQPQVSVIPQSVDLSSLQRDDSLRCRVRAQLGIRQDACIILAFSRLNAGTKGDHHATVSLWRDVLVDAPDAVLVLAGATGPRDFVEDLRRAARQSASESSVIVLPNPYELWPNARHALMSAADICLHLSTGVEEVAPLVVCEAMAYGLVPVVADWSGMREQVQHQETGWIVGTWTPPLPAELIFGAAVGYEPSYNIEVSKSVACDPGEIHRGLVTLATHAALRQDLSTKATAYAQAHFSIARATDARLAVFESAAVAARDTGIRSRSLPIASSATVTEALAGRRLKLDTLVTHASEARAARMPEWLNGDGQEILRLLVAAAHAAAPCSVGTWVAAVHRLLDPEDQASAAELMPLYGRLISRLARYGAVRLATPHSSRMENLT
jgi:glycosyltransferase involved in cell wall biosynthesis